MPRIQELPEKLHDGHVFVSYVGEDAERILKLKADLEELGVKVWLDKTDIRPGERWQTAIRASIEQGTLFIACFSTQFWKRGKTYMYQELRYAAQEIGKMAQDRIWLVPALLDDVDIPDFQMTTTDNLRDIQAVRLYQDWRYAVRAIAQVVKGFGTRREVSFVEIPGGPFLYGSSERDAVHWDDEMPQREIVLPTYHIDKYLVTNEQYCSFLNTVSPQNDDLEHWIGLDRYASIKRERCRIVSRDGRYEVWPGYEKHPVVCVSWFGAVEFAAFAGKRLPTEQEWEKAARSTNGSIYPWGNEWDPTLCNCSECGNDRTSQVGAYPMDRSSYGCFDMAGNVCQWTASDDEQGRKVIRGGSWALDQNTCRCATRGKIDPGIQTNHVGFRCAWDA